MERLDDGEAILIVDETADEKSSTTAAGAARLYSATVGGVASCQVMLTLTIATGKGHTITDRALYLPESWAADEELRELAGVLRGADVRYQAATGRRPAVPRARGRGSGGLCDR